MVASLPRGVRACSLWYRSHTEQGKGCRAHAQGLRTASRRAATAVRTLSVGTAPCAIPATSVCSWPRCLRASAWASSAWPCSSGHTTSPAPRRPSEYLGLVQFLAMLVGILGGSAIVDHVDRRLLLLLTHLGFGVSVGTLLIEASSATHRSPSCS